MSWSVREDKKLGREGNGTGMDNAETNRRTTRDDTEYERDGRRHPLTNPEGVLFAIIFRQTLKAPNSAQPGFARHQGHIINGSPGPLPLSKPIDRRGTSWKRCAGVFAIGVVEATQGTLLADLCASVDTRLLFLGNPRRTAYVVPSRPLTSQEHPIHI